MSRHRQWPRQPPGSEGNPVTKGGCEFIYLKGKQTPSCSMREPAGASLTLLIWAQVFVAIVKLDVGSSFTRTEGSSFAHTGFDSLPLAGQLDLPDRLFAGGMPGLSKLEHTLEAQLRIVHADHECNRRDHRLGWTRSFNWGIWVLGYCSYIYICMYACMYECMNACMYVAM